MNSVVFDTHAAANRFKRAGFTEDQVEALVEVTRETTALPDISTLATKADIVLLKADIEQLRLANKSDIGALKSDIEKLAEATKADVAKLEAKISDAQFKSVGAIITAMAIIVGLGATLPKLLLG